MSDTEIIWAGLSLGGDSPYIISDITGWDDLPEITDQSVPRTRLHGDHPGTMTSRARIVTVTGKVADDVTRNQLVQRLQDATVVSSTVETDLQVETFGRSLRARGRVVRRSVTIGEGYSVGEVPFVIQWRCSDPLRYGPPRTSDPIRLPADGGGLEYPLPDPLSYGAPGSTGQVVLTNAGTAPAPIVFGVTGDLPSGAELSSAATAERLTYARPIPGAQMVEIDTAAGTVLVERTSSRRAALTHADWLHVPARDPQTGKAGELTVQFSSLQSTTNGTARLVATTQDTYW